MRKLHAWVRSLPHRRDEYVTLALLGASLCFNIVLGALLIERRLPHPSSDSTQEVAAGSVLPAIPVVTPEGAPEDLHWSDGGLVTVLYVFSPGCHWCRSNLPSIKALATSRGMSYRFIGLSVTERGLARYRAEGQLPFPIFAVSDRKDIANLHLGSTPQTLVVDKSGQVVFSVPGAYAGSNKRKIDRFFGVRLPGIAPAGE